MALTSITKLSNRKRLLLFALTAANSTKPRVVSNYLTTTATTITIRGHLAVHSAYLWHTVLTLTTNPIPGLAKLINSFLVHGLPIPNNNNNSSRRSHSGSSSNNNQPLYRSMCVSWHHQLRNTGLSRSKVLLPTLPTNIPQTS